MARDRAFAPGYVELEASGELSRRLDVAWALLAPCRLCPHECGVDRLRGQAGACRMDARCRVSSWTLHQGEEPPISGARGSGTIFFSGCSGRCRFCQSYGISQLGYGIHVSDERLAGMMVELQRKGAHNINLVTPSHFVPQILAALRLAIRMGLRLPIVYNGSGFERADTLRLLEGVIDVWLPDAKYSDNSVAGRLSGWPQYVEANRATLREIFRQVGEDLLLSAEGVAQRGMIVRHLVLPGGLSGTGEVLRWLARELSPRVHVSLMDQYFPAYRVLDDAILGRRLLPEEYQSALDSLASAGLRHGWCQETQQGAEGNA